MSMADFRYRVAFVGSDLRGAISLLRSKFDKKLPPADANFVCSARIGHAVLGLPGAEVRIEAASNESFDIEMPYKEVNALKWGTVPVRSLIHIGFREGAIFYGGMTVTNPDVHIGTVVENKALHTDDEPVAPAIRNRPIQRSLTDHTAEPSAMMYLRLLDMKRGAGLTQVWQHQFMKVAAKDIKQGVRALRQFEITPDDIEQILRLRYRQHPKH